MMSEAVTVATERSGNAPGENSEKVPDNPFGKRSKSDKAAEAAKTRRSLDTRIEEAREILKRLEDQKKEEVRQAKLRDEKELRELIKTERLDEFPPATWRACVPELRAVLSKAAKSA